MKHFIDCIIHIANNQKETVYLDEFIPIYVDLMYRITQGNRIYSDLYLYNIGYGATLPQDPGIDRGFLYTDTEGNLMRLRSCHSGVFLVRTKDNRWRYVFTSSKIEEIWHKYERLLRKGEHWNKQLQYYYDVENGDLEIDILELCPKRFLNIARRKWYKYYGQSTSRKYNPVNKDFREEEMI